MALSVTVSISISLIDPERKSVIHVSPHLTEFDWLVKQGRHNNTVLHPPRLDAQPFSKIKPRILWFKLYRGGIAMLKYYQCFLHH